MNMVFHPRSKRFLFGLVFLGCCVPLVAANAQSSRDWEVDTVPIMVGNSRLCVATLVAMRLERYATPIPGKGLAVETLMTLPFNLDTVKGFARNTGPKNEDLASLIDTNVENGFGLDFTQHIATLIKTENDAFQYDWFFSSDERFRIGTVRSYGTIATKVTDYTLDEVANSGDLHISFLAADPNSEDMWTMPSSMGGPGEMKAALVALRACTGI